VARQGDAVVIALAGARRTYNPRSAVPVHALDGVSLEIETGRTVAITGPSGSGKTTLLQIIGGIDRLDDGNATVAGLDLCRASRGRLVQHRQRLGFVFQRFNLLPELSALDNVIVPLLPRRGGAALDARGRELLAAVGLAGREDALPSELSGGQQQRVAIARALIADPILILADEPTGNLHSSQGKEIMELFKRLNDEGTTIIQVTHSEVNASYGDRVVQLEDGWIVKEEK